MSRTKQFRRIVALGALLCTTGLALVGWLYYVQIVSHDDLSRKSADDTRRSIILMPRRGDIKDIHGHLLATSLPVKTVFADPTLIGTNNNQAAVARILAPLLRTNEAWLADRLQIRVHPVERLITNVQQGKLVITRTNYNEASHYVVLKHKVPIEEWEAIRAAMSKITPGWALQKMGREQESFLWNLRTHAIAGEDDQIRDYPNHSLAAHVVGSVASQEVMTSTGKPIKQLSGREGIERRYNSVLGGAAGWRQTEADSKHRELVQYREYDVPARPGNTVVLTVDSRLQDIVEGALAEGMEKHVPEAICCVMIRPKTAEILAMATLPNYDPNEAGHAPLEAHRNRVISWLPEPGSTFKIVVVSGALNDHLVTLDDHFDLAGPFIYAGKPLKDDHPCGVISVEQIIQKSSNIGAAKIGIKMGKEQLYHYIKAFGFGDLSGVPLAGEEYGMVRNQTNWDALEISRIPMGQGIATTPLQMALAMSAIANGGKLMRPILVDHLEDERGNILDQAQPRVVRQVISPEAASQMVTALKSVVTPQGTAVKASMDNYVVAGKTGTAQKQVGGHYPPGRHVTSFIGFFPADDPEVCISVVLDDPRNGYYGGDIAAPIFKAIAEQTANYLNIKPSTRVEPKLGQGKSGGGNNNATRGKLAQSGMGH